MKRKMLLNSSSGLFAQIVAIAVGLILPRLMIQTFGSNVNGLLNSITQFLSYITLFDAGVGGVVKAALYTPLVENDKNKISGILKATDNYFKKIALFFLVYVCALSVLFPLVINKTFDIGFAAPLVFIIAISTFAEYFIGITYSFLIQADARNYIVNFVQAGSTIINAILIVVLIGLDANIFIVKLVSAIVFAIKPFIFAIYVTKKYKGVTRKVEPDYKSLEQRKNALAHHVAWFFHTNTDIVVVTVFGTLANVSVYSVYYMVANSLSKLTIAISSGVEAFFGRRMATTDSDHVREDFNVLRMIMDSVVIVLFLSAGCLLMPFIALYTKGITDANYYLPIFGYTLLLAEGVYCLRLPYHNVITAAGHFKQTQTSAITETTLNIVLSIIFIKLWGLFGVALATLIAMAYRTTYDIYYMSKNLLNVNFLHDFIRVIVPIALSVGLVILKTTYLEFPADSFLNWAIQGLVCFLASIVIAFIYDVIFYNKELKRLKEQLF